jgi:hypothetical protein
MRGPTDKHIAAFKSLTQIQRYTVDRILAIPTSRRTAISHYRLAAKKLGYTERQIAEQVTQIRATVFLCSTKYNLKAAMKESRVELLTAQIDILKRNDWPGIEEELEQKRAELRAALMAGGASDSSPQP